MTNGLYEEQALAEVYDLLNGWGEDNDYYLGLTPRGGRVLDLGCGTGLLAAAMARHAEVTAQDPAAAMLAVARTRPGARKVRWLQADARRFQLAERFELICCAGHAVQVFLSVDDRRALWRNVKRHLAPDGVFAFETRNPHALAWLQWEGQAPRRAVHLRHGAVELSHRLLSERDGLVAYRSHYRFLDQGRERSVDAELRFCDAPTLTAELEAAGLRVIGVAGDWQGGEWRADSREIIMRLGHAQPGLPALG
ncbi:class I SAM-dependent methyltransferase [Chromobacterium subtsugae]|uniref:class I SAM-dependent methyltransferase n=2 Tax=Chromobacterium subtsugae TaxID=251747 RepID=UPI00064100A0|nr:class I SAM-dependent methyltransferase [Chromobacterium subtsugae]